MLKAIIMYLVSLVFTISTFAADPYQSDYKNEVVPSGVEDETPMGENGIVGVFDYLGKENSSDNIDEEVDTKGNSSAIIPESSTAALIGLCGLALIFRRRL